jgi:peptidoglycan/LPS O-acetylase OafA/YrhL
MILAAAVLAPLAYYGGGFAGTHPGLVQMTVLIASGFLLLPAGLLFHQPAFILNVPLWSLFFEWFANAAYFVEARVPMRRAAAVAVLACLAAALAMTILDVGSAGSIGFASPDSFLAGFGRVLYAFFAGVLVQRFRPTGLWRPPAWLLTLALVLMLYSGTGADTPIYDVVAILLLCPAIVALGAGVSGAGRMAGMWRVMGELSYPLYVIHEPVLRAVFAGFGPHAAVLAAGGAVAAAYALLVFYDVPVRKYLSKRSLF